MKNMVWTIQASCILGLVVLSGCASTLPPPPIAPGGPVTIQDQATIQKAKDQAIIQALHRRLHEQEQTIAIQGRQIEVMSSQLDALKRIDQDMRDRQRPVRRSVIVAP